MTFENDEFYDEFYATTCPKCNENSIDEFESICGHCFLNEFIEVIEDSNFEMGLGLE